MKAECINASGTDLLCKGRVYVVTKLSGQFWGSSKYICIDNGGGFADGGWSPSRFRPIVSRPTSIAVFEEILRKVNAPALPATRTDEVLA
jgi:hypothetical protein